MQTTQLETALTYEAKGKGLTGNLILELQNKSNQNIQIVVEDLAYKTPT